MTPYALRSLAYGKDIFVAIGERGAIFNSPDGIYWARKTSQHTSHLNGLTYAKGAFVAVGAEGRILTSMDDGATWTERYSGTTEHLTAAAYGNGKYVAVGAYGTIVSSPDARNWTTERSGSTSFLGAAAYAGKKFIVVATDGTVLESPDGTNWSFSRYRPIVIAPLAPMAKEPVVSLKYEPRVVETVVIVAAEPTAEEKMMAAAAAPKIMILAFEDVHFDIGKETLKPETQTILKRNLQMLKDNTNARIRIACYTSAPGAESYNQELSERRANAVHAYLINEGIIAPDRLSTIGYGETHPAAYEAAPKELYSVAAKTKMMLLFEIIIQ